MPKRPEFAPLPPETVAEAIGCRFADPALLRAALTHASLDPAAGMERLEFLGDAVLGMAVSELLFRARPAAPEGELTALKAWLVRKETLIEVARDWRVFDAVRVGVGERTRDGRLRSPSIAADAVEAVLGAVFLDGGWEAARAVVARFWGDRVAAADPAEVIDPKTQLQELTQGRGWGLPAYRVEDRGPGRALRYRAECVVRGEPLGEGEAERKKDAERLAARRALAALQERSG